MQDESTLGDDSVPFPVYLEGNSDPVDVTINEALGHIMVGELGPLPEFDPGIEVAESTIPDQIGFTPLGPDFPSVEVESTVYAGRVAGTTIDVFVFSMRAAGGIPVDNGTPAIAIYAFDGTHVAGAVMGWTRHRTRIFETQPLGTGWW